MNRHSVIACVLFAFLPIGAAVHAEEPEAMAEAFIAKVQANKSSEAVDFLYGSNPWMKQKTDAITNIRNQLGSLGNLIGSLRNHERLQNILVGTR